jgi:3-oxoacyl-[acyl-carrier-protein] synthase III
MRSTASRPSVSLIDVSAYLPEKRIPAEYYANFAGTDDLRGELMFRAPQFRHHARKDESNVDMMQRAVAGLVERHGADVVSNVDILLTHSQLPDHFIQGCGGEAAHRLGMEPPWVHDVHNGGCAAFVHLMRLARSMLTSGSGQTALIAVAQSGAGKIFDQEEVRKKAQSSVPGDGTAVGLLRVSDESPILDILCRYCSEFAGDMTMTTTDPKHSWWQAGTGEPHVGFDESSITDVIARGNRLVPEMALAVCDRIGVRSQDLDLLVTNQPNRVFLRKWRKAMGLPRERHHDTFDECGDLFGVGIPVNFDSAINAGRVKAGDTVTMAGFAHAGDFAGAAAIRWGGRG